MFSVEQFTAFVCVCESALCKGNRTVRCCVCVSNYNVQHYEPEIVLT